MIRKLRFLLLLFAAAPLWGVITDSVILTNPTGGTITNAPIQINRFFVSGEIAAYPQPFVDGNPIGTWQVDRKSQYGGASCKQAIITFYLTFTANQSHTITFQSNVNPSSSGNLAATQAAGLSILGMQSFQESSGGAQDGWNAIVTMTASSIAKTANARTILNACGTISTDWNTLGCRYWLLGPVVTDVILEDRSSARAYDFGWTCTATCPTGASNANDLTGSTWVSDTTNKVNHPIFEAEFWAGSIYLRFDILMEIPWITLLQDQGYSTSVTTGSGAGSVTYTQPLLGHYAMTRWHKRLWNAGAPTAIKMDLNLPYMISTGVVPNYDTSLVVPAGSVSADISNWAASDQCDLANAHGPAGGAKYAVGLWLLPMESTGARPDIGLVTAWQWRALFTMDPTLVNYMNIAEDCEGYNQIVVRDSNPALFFDSGHTVSAQGHFFSLEARSTAWIVGNNINCNPNATGNCNNPPGLTAITPLVQLSGADAWGYDNAHQPPFAYTPYLFSGDWYMWENVVIQAAYALQTASPGTASYQRNGTMGYLSTEAIQTRGGGWAFRNVAEAAFVSPDGSPEAAYFTQKILNNIDIMEGFQNITNGHANGTGAAWTYGKNTVLTHDGTLTGGNPLRFINTPDVNGSTEQTLCANRTVCYIDSPWQINYRLNALGHGWDLGFPMATLMQVMMAYDVNIVLNPALNPWLIGTYRVPVQDVATSKLYATWGAVLAKYSNAYTGALPSCMGQNPVNFQTLTFWDCDTASGAGVTVQDGYPQIARAALSYAAGITLLPADGSYSGTAAWNWINDPARQVSTQSGLSGLGRWAVLPRNPTTPSPPSLRSGSGRASGTAGLR